MGQPHHTQPAPAGYAPISSFVQQQAAESAACARQAGPLGEGRTIVLTRPLLDGEWQMIRTFVQNTDRDDLRLRFGQSIDFRDDSTLRRFFGIDGTTGELICVLDGAGDISGILHCVLLSPCDAEIALIVRSDRKRRGIGQKLLRTALARAAAQNLKTLRATILWENTPMRRLARKIGLVPRKSAGFTVEVEVYLDR